MIRLLEIFGVILFFIVFLFQFFGMGWSSNFQFKKAYNKCMPKFLCGDNCFNAIGILLEFTLFLFTIYALRALIHSNYNF